MILGQPQCLYTCRQRTELRRNNTCVHTLQQPNRQENMTMCENDKNNTLTPLTAWMVCCIKASSSTQRGLDRRIHLNQYRQRVDCDGPDNWLSSRDSLVKLVSRPSSVGTEPVRNKTNTARSGATTPIYFLPEINSYNDPDTCTQVR